jgi:hypothetical protein
VRDESPDAPAPRGAGPQSAPSRPPAGPSPFEDEEHDPQDDLMEQAWLANREESTAHSDDEGGVPNDD